MKPNAIEPTAPSGEAQTDELFAKGCEIVRRLASVADAWDRVGDETAHVERDALRAVLSRLASLSTERARMERERDEAVLGEYKARQRIIGIEYEVSRLTSELDRVRGALTEIAEYQVATAGISGPSLREQVGLYANAWQDCQLLAKTALGVTPTPPPRREG